MRLHILADLHFEFGAVKIPVTDADVVVLAGDVHLGREGRIWARNQFFAKPVIYVLGNHEFYRHSLPELTETLKRETDGSNIHLLENGAVEINGYTFLGCTLWTDFRLGDDLDGSMRVAEAIMSDYGIVQFSTENRRLRPCDTARLHAESVAWLRCALAKCDRARTIVVTCHRAVENRPPAGTSKPATPRSFIHIRFLGAGKGLSISHICWRDHS